MFAYILSFLAGILTVFAPCILPLLPVIVGGGLEGSQKDKRRPYIVTASLVVSLVTFTLLLRASTRFIGIDPRVWSSISGVLVIAMGVFMLLPMIWARTISKVGIEHRSQKLLGKAYTTNNGTASAILIGAALGPVFNSCSPTYAWVIANVLPNSLASGLVHLFFYCLGLALVLLAVTLLGKRLTARLSWAINPGGLLQRSIAVIFILVGLFIMLGWDKKVQTYLVEKDFLHLISIETKLVPKD